MLHWFTQAAASSNATEGLFYLGWAHHRGLGTPRNVSRAKELYRQAADSAGKLYARAMAPLLGLTALWVEALLEPVAGGEEVVVVAAEGGGGGSGVDGKFARVCMRMGAVQVVCKCVFVLRAVGVGVGVYAAFCVRVCVCV